MELYKQDGSKYWTAYFVVDGRRYRKSTKQTTKAKAGEVAASFLRQAQRNETPVRKGQMMKLRQFAEERFLPFVEASTLAENTKLCYKHGWKTLKALPVVDLRLDCITTSVADTPGTQRLRGQSELCSTHPAPDALIGSGVRHSSSSTQD